MNFYEKILKLAEKNGGYITTKELVNNNINKKFLTNLVRDGKLLRLSRGYYGLPNYIQDDYYILLSKSQNAVFSLATALYFHDLSERVPLIYNITLPYGYSGALQKERNVSLNFVKKELLNLGVIEIESPFGMKVKVYDVEKTICDIIKHKNKMDAEIFSKALKFYARRKDKNINKLMRYAQKMNIEKKVVEYMEVLL